MPGPLGPIAMMAIQYGMNSAAAKQSRELGMRSTREATALQYGTQMDMWNKTNYPAQVEQMKKAGLNPGLMYGMGGGGGATTGAGAANSGSVNVAPIDVATFALMKAQKENIEADTANKKAGAEYTGGAQTDKTKAETDYTKGVQTDKTDAEAKLTGEKLSTQIAETGIKRIQLDIADKTSNEQIAIINQAARKIEGEAASAEAQGKVDTATVRTQILQQKANLLATAIHNKLMESQKGLTDAQAWATAESVGQRWKAEATARINAMSGNTQASTSQEQMFNNKMVNDISESTKLNQRWVESVIHGLGRWNTPGKK